MCFVFCSFVFIYNRKQSVVQRKFVPVRATEEIGKWRHSSTALLVFTRAMTWVVSCWPITAGGPGSILGHYMWHLRWK